MKLRFKWQKETLKRIKDMSNVDLLEKTLEAGSGDDWDGAFTKRGWFEYEKLQEELKLRLIKNGFISRAQT